MNHPSYSRKEVDRCHKNFPAQFMSAERAITGQRSSEVYLLNLGVQLVNILTELQGHIGIADILI